MLLSLVYLRDTRKSCKAITYENIAKRIAKSQEGTTVLSLRPIPNWRREPSLL